MRPTLLPSGDVGSRGPFNVFSQRGSPSWESDKDAHCWASPSQILIREWVPGISIWNKNLAVLQDTLENKNQKMEAFY